MHIGIDGYEANTDIRVGIGQYAYQLLWGLYKLDQDNQYMIFLPHPPLLDMPEESKNWRYVVGRPGVLWTILQLPQLIRRESLDLFFSPTHYAPWFTKLSQVLSVMDLSYLHYPQMFRTKDLLQLKYMGAISIKRAQKILTISEFSKKEIIEYYGYPERNIVVTYPGFNSEKSHPDPEASSGFSGSQVVKMLKQVQHDKLRRYILFVGTLQPRKNIVRLIEAFEMLDQQDVQLVLVGKKGWLYEPIMHRIENSGRKEQIVYLDFVTDEELQVLYKNAACFCLPSLYEGFGIPVVEALTNSCPVVVSNTSILPEVAGDAGIYVDPLSADIAAGLKKALQLTVAERKRLVEKGQKHIQRFTWQNCARKTIKVFESI